MPGLRPWPRDAAERFDYAGRIFGSIAGRYDLFTRLLSFGQDERWKREAAEAALAVPAPRLLDLATGTGALPEALRRRGHDGGIIGLDRSGPMVARGRLRLARARVLLVRGDLNRLPFRAGAFDAITMGYGLRYLAEPGSSLREMHALLRPGGILVSLDFGLPDSQVYRGLCLSYLLAAGTAWGLLLHGRPETYHHIVESLRAYPGQGWITEEMRKAGFVQVTRRDFLGGIAALLAARKPGPGAGA